MCTSHTTIVHATTLWFSCQHLQLGFLKYWSWNKCIFLPLQVKKNPWFAGANHAVKKKNKLTFNSIIFSADSPSSDLNPMVVSGSHKWLIICYLPPMKGTGNSIDEPSELLFEFSDRLLPQPKLSPLAEISAAEKLTQNKSICESIGSFLRKRYLSQWPKGTLPLKKQDIAPVRSKKEMSFSNHPFSGAIRLFQGDQSSFWKFWKKTLLSFPSLQIPQEIFRTKRFSALPLSFTPICWSCLLATPPIGSVPFKYSHFPLPWLDKSSTLRKKTSKRCRSLRYDAKLIWWCPLRSWIPAITTLPKVCLTAGPLFKKNHFKRKVIFQASFWKKTYVKFQDIYTSWSRFWRPYGVQAQHLLLPCSNIPKMKRNTRYTYEN